MGLFADHQPMFVEVETTTYCNRRCSYCPNSVFDRGLRANEVQMPEDLFHKIVQDLGRNHFCNQFSPHNYGEPLADERMPRLLEMARHEMPRARIALYTNGDYLTPQLFEQISPSVDAFVITQHGEKMPPGVKEIFDEFGGSHPKIRYKTSQAIKLNASNRAGLIPMQVKRREACGVVMNELHINAHGQLILCCEDYLARKVFGNMREMTVEEAWSSPERMRVHRANVRGDFALDQCVTCGYGRIT
ncbi:SPASM domain-containing protein [Streptomyces sp. NA02950]|uniref:radical SAM/SPASM domain-containing protein n=1 Tax=Streptomyces sp. NA02950 TaxID=2742137 RepID=UPI0015918324|nr:radical SAM/SPASM domain-containing protein [Streptomyces sp. NA02950]QKV94914.1 SPASM domain-containing protein [Streptomyces sp. NA02950]